MNPTQGWESLLRLAVFGPFMLLALYGLYYCRQRQWQLAPLWLFFLVYPLPYYVTHVDHGRYSYPVEPLVLMLAVTPMVVWFHGNQELFGTRKRGNGAGS
jgi:hypothetical protein